MNKNRHIKTFNELSISELYGILRLRSEVFVVEQNCVYLDIDNKDQIAWHLFIKDDEQIIAYARIFRAGDYFDNASIGRVVVKKEYRGQDLGKEIMQIALDFILNNLKENSIEISGQTYLNKFYSELGFVPVGETYLEDGLPHQKMILK